LSSERSLNATRMGVKRHQFPYAAPSAKGVDGQVMANGQTVDLKFPLKNIAKLPADQLPTKKELQDSIPAHCFKHSIPRALALVLRDAVIIGCIFHLGWNYLPMEKSPLFSVAWFGETAAWHMYWFWQGTALTGWWVLAHECGHRGFSDNTYLCDAVGWVLHSFLLVPYFSWQYTHSVHHSKTNHLLDGESHVPHAIGNPAVTLPEKIERMSLNQRFFDAIGEDAFAIYQIFTHCLLGWPMYLLFNVSGSKRTTEGASVTSVRDHFRPSSKLFPGHRGWDFRVLMSTVGVCMALFGLFLAGEHFGHSKVFWIYFPSYLWNNFWLIMYTWLQHTAHDLPHFGADEWTWVRGGLCTIDRNYGIFDFMHHNIGSTHVCHHLFSRTPCYHAVEATAALKAYLEPKGLYHYDDTNWVVAAWRVAHECHYVEEDKGIQHFKSMKDMKKDK